MSRIGKKTIEIPQGVNVEIKDKTIFVQGSKGKLERKINDLITINKNDNFLSVSVKNEEDKKERSLWGTYASHIQNMIDGVTKGFTKVLEINGVGYKVAMQGKDLKLELGFSHPVIFKIPEVVEVKVEKNQITLFSADKELLGITAAEIRALRKPEPYKGKGIKYLDEIIRKKAGKTASKGE
ncbi:MAG: 50S ribosomal protein L6 [Patescibacteria group bacterium]